jgi:hypothetical protein
MIRQQLIDIRRYSPIPEHMRSIGDRRWMYSDRSVSEQKKTMNIHNEKTVHRHQTASAMGLFGSDKIVSQDGKTALGQGGGPACMKWPSSQILL